LTGNREYGDLQDVGIVHYLSNYQHLNGLARTLGKVHLLVRMYMSVQIVRVCFFLFGTLDQVSSTICFLSLGCVLEVCHNVLLNAKSLLRHAESQMSNQLAVIAGLETEKTQMQVPLLFCWGFCCFFRLARVRFSPDFIVCHECTDKKGSCQGKLLQVQGRLDELKSGLTEAGVADKHDLLLLTDQARSVIASSSCCAGRLCMSFCACERYLMFWKDSGAGVSKAFQIFNLSASHAALEHRRANFTSESNNYRRIWITRRTRTKFRRR
jgi:hypothetical protein